MYLVKTFHLLVVLRSFSYMFITLCLDNCILWNMEKWKTSGESFLHNFYKQLSPLETPTI